MERTLVETRGLGGFASTTEFKLTAAGQSTPVFTDSGRQTRLPAGIGMLGGGFDRSVWASGHRKPSSAMNTTYWLYEYVSIGGFVRGIWFCHPPFGRCL